ncbi:MAG TPA: UDP-3-O-(3-hydroxymyristoyl)glucosamine N-acyltransferase, partial [Phycisphaerales bacterium]|nr:UDP-3-O-(3-hydroxymyristoyl)glucosamine N-acyltransferase [Phycisphaerales bacterium]
TTGQLAAELGAALTGPADIAISGAEALDQAAPGQVAFVRSPKFAKAWPSSRASAVLVTRGIELAPGAALDGSPRAVLTVTDADLAMTRVLELLMPAAPVPAPGVHQTAIVDSSAAVHPSAHVGPFVTVGPGSTVASGAVLHAGVRIGAAASIGEGTVLHANVVVQDRCVIGARCVLHPAVVIGADGFGYRFDPISQSLLKIPHIGHVHVGNDVEVGAGSCIDRGKFGATTVGDGTKIDNLVQVGHNCRVGRGVIICGCVALAGSVTIGDGVMIGGGAGVADNITVGAGARIAGKSGVMNDVPPGETVTGAPALPHRDWARAHVALRRLADPPERPEKPV